LKKQEVARDFNWSHPRWYDGCAFLWVATQSFLVAFVILF